MSQMNLTYFSHKIDDAGVWENCELSISPVEGISLNLSASRKVNGTQEWFIRSGAKINGRNELLRNQEGDITRAVYLSRSRMNEIDGIINTAIHAGVSGKIAASAIDAMNKARQELRSQQAQQELPLEQEHA